MLQIIKKLLGLGPEINFKELVENGAVIIDVRTKGEYKNGHLDNAINIPLDVVGKEIEKFEKDKIVITCCASGMRSASAKSLLKSKGYANVHNGGSWVSLKNKLAS